MSCVKIDLGMNMIKDANAIKLPTHPHTSLQNTDIEY